MPRQSSFASDTEAEMSDERRAEIERGAIARTLRDWIHETPLSQCNMGSDMCDDWPLAWEVAGRVTAALDRLRDARGDDEAARCGCNELLGGHRDECPKWGDPPAARSPQGEDHEDDEWHYTTEKPSSPDCPMCGKPWRSPQGEDHEAGRLAKLADWLERDRREPDKVIAYAQEVRRLSRVSAPKADEKAPSEQNADGG